jgi:uncharacterized membrane protein (DUF4010 family)
VEQTELFERFLVALALGFLIGFERGWQERDAPEGSRIAGIRTFAITGLLGGFWALLSEDLGEIVLAAAFLAFAALLIAGKYRQVKNSGDRGITTIVAAMLTFALGATAVRGHMGIAAAGAVMTSLLLGVKPPLHRMLTLIDRDELLAVLKLLAMTLVLLPVLPDKGYGPWQAFNPFQLWGMVILIAAISFVGYVAVKLLGTRRGVLVAGAAGGLVSSTAVTLNFSRLARRSSGTVALLSSGILTASATMFPRTVLIAWVIDPQMGRRLALPLLVAGIATLAIALLYWRRPAHRQVTPDLRLRNPFEFTAALQFGVLLTAVMFLSRALRSWWGDGGLYVLAAISGLSDVDPINLSLSGLVADRQLAVQVGVIGLLIAILSNTVVKGVLAATQGGRPVGIRVGLGFLASAVAGGAGFAISLMV